jgi:hypothetical protein
MQARALQDQRKQATVDRLRRTLGQRMLAAQAKQGARVSHGEPSTPAATAPAPQVSREELQARLMEVGGDVDALVAQLGLPPSVAAAAKAYADTPPEARDLVDTVARLNLTGL